MTTARSDRTLTAPGASTPALFDSRRLRGHIPVLDGVRGLAIALVLLFHFVGNTLPTGRVEAVVVAVSNYGAYGVELFFVLSGFLITGILYDGSEKPHYFRNFYMRRVLRIFPLYYGVLVLLFFVVPMIPVFWGPTLDYLVDRQAWAWLYAVNIYIAVQGAWSFSYLDHFWSLAVEEQFYLFWPFVVFMLARRPRALVAATLAISLGAMSARIIGSLLGVNWWTTYVLTPFRMDGLALGAFLAVTARQPGGMDRLTKWVPYAGGLLGGMLALTFVPTLIARQYLALVLPVRAVVILMLLGCVLVWALIAPEDSRLSRFFRSRTMTFLGTYSYGLYVYHHFISYYLISNRTELQMAQWLGSHGAAVALQAVLGVSLSIAIAYVSYEYFEKRFLKLKRSFETNNEPPLQRPAGGVVGAP